MPSHSGHHAGLTIRGTEHSTMSKSNPPMGFVSRDWSEGTRATGPISNGEILLPGLVPIPVSGDDGRTLDWSRSQKHDGTSSFPLAVNPTIQRKHPVLVNDSGARTDRVRPVR